MRLSELVDIEGLRKEITNAGLGLLDVWMNTALDIAWEPGSKLYEDIVRHRRVYEMPEEELNPDKFIDYAEGILRILKLPDKQKLFVRAEMLAHQIFE